MTNTNTILSEPPFGKFIPYTATSSNFQTGDLLLWHGTDDFSAGARRLTNSLFSHLGLIVVLPPTLYPEPLLWHSAPSRKGELTLIPPPDVYAPKATLDEHRLEFPPPYKRSLNKAVKLVPLLPTLQRFQTVKFYFSYRKLHLPQGLNITPLVCDFIRDVQGAPFTAFNLDDIWREYQLGNQGLHHNNPSFACGELVSATLMHCGLLSKVVPPNAYWPTDLSSENPALPLLQNARYEPEQWFALE